MRMVSFLFVGFMFIYIVLSIACAFKRKYVILSGGMIILYSIVVFGSEYEWQYVLDIIWGGVALVFYIVDYALYHKTEGKKCLHLDKRLYFGMLVPFNLILAAIWGIMWAIKL